MNLGTYADLGQYEAAGSNDVVEFTIEETLTLETNANLGDSAVLSLGTVNVTSVAARLIWEIT